MILESKYWIVSCLFGFLLLVGCSSAVPETQQQSPTFEHQFEPTNTVQLVPEEAAVNPTIMPATPARESMPEPTNTPDDQSTLAEVLSVSVNGEPGDYSFSVRISSPDEGCSQYADWWEVISPDGELIYRRVLLHSHVDEQPFTRSGGPVSINTDEVVIVRAHMNTNGYGSLVMQGSPEQGFELIELSPGFAVGLSEQPPLPGDCGF